MSAEEEMTARGQIVTDFLDAKKRFAAVENELHRLGQKLNDLGSSLVHDPTAVKLDSDTLAALDGNKLTGLVTDARRAYADKTRLRSKMVDLGLSELLGN